MQTPVPRLARLSGSHRRWRLCEGLGSRFARRLSGVCDARPSARSWAYSASWAECARPPCSSGPTHRKLRIELLRQLAKARQRLAGEHQTGLAGDQLLSLADGKASRLHALTIRVTHNAAYHTNNQHLGRTDPAPVTDLSSSLWRVIQGDTSSSSIRPFQGVADAYDTGDDQP